MSSFSRFLKELPFLPKNFRSKQETGASSGGADLTGITINVYELEVNDSSTDVSRDDESDQATTVCPTPRPEDNLSERMPSSAATSGLDVSSAQKLRYANIVVFCRRCKNEISVRYVIQHRRRHEALEILKYSPDFPPKTMRGLLRRRNKSITDVLGRPGFDQGQVFYYTQKINMAFGILKAEIEGMDKLSISTSRWREKDIRTDAKLFNSGLLLGISKYRTPERGLSVTKTVHIDHFLEKQGIFFAIYQGYNGNYVANLCARELHKEIKESLHHFSEIAGNSERIKSAFQEAYRKIDKIQLVAEEEHPWKRWSGCSAVTCLVLNHVLYVANVGSVKGFLVRENSTIRGITSSHDLYNRKERARVRKRCGVIVKTERCALVNGVLETTRGLGNQGDWRLKICVVNKPKFRVLSLKMTDKMAVLGTEGVWKVFSYDDALFILMKFLRDASTKRQSSQENLCKMKSPDGKGFLEIPTLHLDAEYRSFLRKRNVNPIDARVPQLVTWNPDNPEIVIRRASIVAAEEPLLKQEETTSLALKCYFTESEEDDEDLQEMSKILNLYNTQSSYSRREIARLLSKRLLKSALIAGAETDNVAIVLLLEHFDVEEYKMEN